MYTNTQRLQAADQITQMEHDFHLNEQSGNFLQDGINAAATDDQNPVPACSYVTRHVEGIQSSGDNNDDFITKQTFNAQKERIITVPELKEIEEFDDIVKRTIRKAQSIDKIKYNKFRGTIFSSRIAKKHKLKAKVRKCALSFHKINDEKYRNYCELLNEAIKIAKCISSNQT